MHVPLLSVHCSHCRKCIYALDHHCYFLGHCIGRGNQRFFIVFCLYAAMGSAIGRRNQNKTSLEHWKLRIEYVWNQNFNDTSIQWYYRLLLYEQVFIICTKWCQEFATSPLESFLIIYFPLPLCGISQVIKYAYSGIAFMKTIQNYRMGKFQTSFVKFLFLISRKERV